MLSNSLSLSFSLLTGVILPKYLHHPGMSSGLQSMEAEGPVNVIGCVFKTKFLLRYCFSTVCNRKN